MAGQGANPTSMAVKSLMDPSVGGDWQVPPVPQAVNTGPQPPPLPTMGALPAPPQPGSVTGGIDRLLGIGNKALGAGWLANALTSLTSSSPEPVIGGDIAGTLSEMAGLGWW
jgi:hypothetical protein